MFEENLILAVQEKWVPFCTEMYEVIKKHFNRPAEGVLATTVFLTTLIHASARNPEAVKEAVIESIEIGIPFLEEEIKNGNL